MVWKITPLAGSDNCKPEIWPWRRIQHLRKVRISLINKSLKPPQRIGPTIRKIPPFGISPFRRCYFPPSPKVSYRHHPSAASTAIANCHAPKDRNSLVFTIFPHSALPIALPAVYLSRLFEKESIRRTSEPVAWRLRQRHSSFRGRTIQKFPFTTIGWHWIWDRSVASSYDKVQATFRAGRHFFVICERDDIPRAICRSTIMWPVCVVGFNPDVYLAG